MSDFPTSIIFTDGTARRTEGGFYLHGFSETGDHVSVRVFAYDVPDLENAGRLVFNCRLIEVRSEEETRIIALIKAADLSDELLPIKPGIVEYHPSGTTGRVGLERIRGAVIAFLESDEYVSIAKNGVTKLRPPWESKRTPLF